MLKKKIYSDNFKSDYKKNPFDFTRERTLPFVKRLVIMMRKSMKSLQNVLNETQRELSLLWNEDSDYAHFNGYRVLAVDGSIVTLPYSKDIRESFNTMQEIKIRTFQKRLFRHEHRYFMTYSTILLLK